MIQLIALLLLTISAGAILIWILILTIYCMIASLRKKITSKQILRMKKAGMSFAALMVLNMGLITLSQMTAFTPAMRDENDRVIKDSISTLEKIELNGRRQWISLRGRDKNNPVLLFLAGGPGGTQMAAVRHELADLEEHFVVVNWDQPGSGKSYHAERIKRITMDTYVQDGLALTEYLKERFHQDKIYLIGESWGSALGIFLIDRHPESYHAFIGTGQMIDFAETERMDYAKALEIAEIKEDEAIIKKLEANKCPPYYGKDVLWKSSVYLNYLSKYMTHNPEIDNAGYNTFRDIASSEYGLLDKINYIRGIMNTYNHVYQQLYTVNLRTDYTRLDVPVSFFLGKYDINAPTSLAEEYVEVLNAPKRDIVWFEHSGHSPWINERNKFMEEVVSCFLKNKSRD